jgi:hypothetical protein
MFKEISVSVFLNVGKKIMMTTYDDAKKSIKIYNSLVTHDINLLEFRGKLKQKDMLLMKKMFSLLWLCIRIVKSIG